MRILVADDDPEYLTSLSRLLTGWGFDVVTAENGAEAWAVLRQEDAPTLAILDWLMPEMDGCEVCRRMRESKGSLLPYILLMTGNCQREEILKVLVVGADDYLLKPFEPLDLKMRIRTAMRILNLQAELASHSDVQTAVARSTM